MLHEFIAANRDAIIARSRGQTLARVSPSVSPRELDFGVPLFLTQLAETLRSEATAMPAASGEIAVSAAREGGELLKAGFHVNQVVHHYGDICQTITQLALDQGATITVGEFQTLNHCLDTAIAGAVAEHTRLAGNTRSGEEVQRLGRTAHELRDSLNAALLAFHALKQGTVGINGTTGAVLGRSLTRLKHVIDRALAEVRLAAGAQHREYVSVRGLIDEIAAIGALHAEDRRVAFTVAAVDNHLAVVGDPQLLTSAVMNLLHNAFKFTPVGGRVALSAYGRDGRLFIDVEDECGGLPERSGEPFQPFTERRGKDRSGLGLGLSIARKAVRAHGGDILVRNIPRKGCVFTIDVPLAADNARVPQSVA